MEQRAFLFTDIEGSTLLWERFPAAMRRVLAEHNRIIRSAVEAANGRVFKTIGDALCADFPTVDDALNSAVAAQLALESFDWQSAGLESVLRVRMAIHAGRVTEEEGELSGPVLNRVSRLLAAGHGGQMLIAGPAADALKQKGSAGIELRSLGERRLKDVPGVERILQVVAPGLPDAFAPIRTLDPVAQNLPIAPTSCLGREDERLLIRAFFSSPGTRLVTLVGPGGIGKTRLAIQAGHDLLDEQRDGVWFVDLSAVRDDALVPGTVMRTLGASEEPGETVESALVRWLADRQLLLVVDNCEQIIDGAARLVARILGSSAGVRVLATSRIALEIRGEQRLPVSPLALPEERRSPDVDEMAASPSVQLFVERATSVQPAFSLDTASAPVVADICRRVDGIPLAIELAAARTAALTLTELQAQLVDRLPSLVGGARDLPDRQRTLRDAIAWSYDLLSAKDRLAFEQLSVFAGGWRIEAATQVVGPSVSEALDSLVLQSLLRADRADGRQPRYDMLETIREFAQTCLTGAGNAEALRDRHAACFVDLAAEASPSLLGDEHQAVWMQRIDQEYGNLMAARTWLKEKGDSESLLRMGSDIWHFWSLRGVPNEGAEWLENALRDSEGVDPAVRARALRKLGNIWVELGNTRDANRVYGESFAIEQLNENAEGIAESLGSLGMVALMQGRYGEYRQLLEQSAAFWQQSGNIRGKAVALNNIAWGYREEGRPGESRDAVEQVMELQRELRDDVGIAYSRLLLGQLALDVGDADQTEQYLDRALNTFRNSSDVLGEARTSVVLAKAYARRGDNLGARRLLQNALATFEEHRDAQGSAETSEALAHVECDAGNRETARDLLSNAHNLRRNSGFAMPFCERETHADLMAKLAIQVEI